MIFEKLIQDLKISQKEAILAFEILLGRLVKFLNHNSALEIPDCAIILVQKNEDFTNLNIIPIRENNVIYYQLIYSDKQKNNENLNLNISLNPVLINSDIDLSETEEAKNLIKKSLEQKISDYLPNCKIILNYTKPRGLSARRVQNIEELYLSEEKLKNANSETIETEILDDLDKDETLKNLNERTIDTITYQKEQSQSFVSQNKDEKLFNKNSRQSFIYENISRDESSTRKIKGEKMQTKKEKLSPIFWSVLFFAITLAIGAVIYFLNYDRIFYKKNLNSKNLISIKEEKNAIGNRIKDTLKEENLKVEESQKKIEGAKDLDQKTESKTSKQEQMISKADDINKNSKEKSQIANLAKGEENKILNNKEIQLTPKNEINIEIKPEDPNDKLIENKFVNGALAYNGLYYSYQILSTPLKNRALQEAQKVRRAGFNVFIQEFYKENERKKYFRVRLGPFNSMNEAKNIAEKYENSKKRK